MTSSSFAAGGKEVRMAGIRLHVTGGGAGVIGGSKGSADGPAGPRSHPSRGWNGLSMKPRFPPGLPVQTGTRENIPSEECKGSEQLSIGGVIPSSLGISLERRGHEVCTSERDLLLPRQ